ncbi:MAG: glutathione S-transferase [Burkholderiaceae bacterium]
MKFYDCSSAPSPKRVRMFIAEKGLEIPTVEINLRDREQLTPEFLNINPHATVPVLELDDGTRLVTTAGCRAYLESVHPEPPLLGRTPTERGQIADLIARIEIDALGATAECLRNSAKAMKDRALTGPVDYAQIPELGERGRARARHFFPQLDKLIGDKPYLVGDAFSAADIDAFIFVGFVKWIKVEVPADCRNVARWLESISMRPSAGL